MSTWEPARTGTLRPLGNRDPYSGAMVLSRGIVGTRGERATVASPMYKQVFDLETGVCLDDGAVAVPVHGVRVLRDRVQVLVAPAVRRWA